MPFDLTRFDEDLKRLAAFCEVVLERRQDVVVQLSLVERLSSGSVVFRTPTGLSRTTDYLFLCVAAAAESVQIEGARGSGDSFFGAVATLRHELLAVICELALLRGDGDPIGVPSASRRR